MRASTTIEPRAEYAALYSEATRLAGEPDDIAQRCAILYEIYRQSAGNHPFPLIVLHGALWADEFLRHIPRLIAFLNHRYRFNRERRERYAASLMAFATGLKTINRQVFIDTYAIYYFTRDYGHAATALALLPSEMVEGLLAMHDAVRVGVPLGPGERRQLYVRCLHQEQETTVAPGVEREMARLTFPLLRRLILRPPVRFAYFRFGVVYWFRDFARKEERITRAIAAYDEAVHAGWPRVSNAIADYHLLPASFHHDPARFVATLIDWLQAAPETRGPVPGLLRGLQSTAVPRAAESDERARG